MAGEAHYDRRETRDPSEREEALFAALADQIANAQRNAPAFAAILAGVEAQTVRSREALAALPVTRKSQLIERQKASPPFGGLAAVSMIKTARVFASPGPICEPESYRRDFWRTARALYAAGFRRGDLVHNGFAYHFTPAGSMFETGAHALGCPVFPAGTGQTELQVEAIEHLRPRGYVGTPSFLKIILDRGARRQADTSSLTKALMTGEALPPSLREELQAKGVDTYQCYCTADLGLIAYESPVKEGLIMDEDLVLEIVRPGTGDPVPEGEVGEVVVTTLNPDYPLIRFATGDLSAVLSGPSPCGRTNTRIKGWMGRADQTTKVKGMFVHPEQVAEVVARFPEVLKGRLVVEHDESGGDRMTLQCEVHGVDAEALPQAIAGGLRDVCKLRGEVRLVGLGTLPNDGKVIEDLRNFEVDAG